MRYPRFHWPHRLYGLGVNTHCEHVSLFPHQESYIVSSSRVVPIATDSRFAIETHPPDHDRLSNIDDSPHLRPPFNLNPPGFLVRSN